jgi:hypothetical protein
VLVFVDLLELLRKTRRRRERLAQALGIQAGRGFSGHREISRALRPAEIAALLT